jgi:molybdate transport system permease protein
MKSYAPLWLSLRVASIATVLAFAIGLMLAYLLAKSRFRGRGIVEAIVTAPMVLPPTVLGYYLLTSLGTRSSIGQVWKRIFGTPLVFTVTAAVIAATLSALPMIVRSARAAIEDVDHRVEAAGRATGLSEWRVARHITLPLARRGIGAGVALGFARALGDFGATVMLAGNIPGRTQTLPVAIYDAVQSGNDSSARIGSLILGLIAVVVLVLVGRLSSKPRRS